MPGGPKEPCKKAQRMHACMYVCVYVCVYVYVCICTCIYICIGIRLFAHLSMLYNYVRSCLQDIHMYNCI